MPTPVAALEASPEVESDPEVDADEDLEVPRAFDEVLDTGPLIIPFAASGHEERLRAAMALAEEHRQRSA